LNHASKSVDVSPNESDEDSFSDEDGSKRDLSDVEKEQIYFQKKLQFQRRALFRKTLTL
jgi:hypothetical protein